MRFLVARSHRRSYVSGLKILFDGLLFYTNRSGSGQKSTRVCGEDHEGRRNKGTGKTKREERESYKISVSEN